MISPKPVSKNASGQVYSELKKPTRELPVPPRFLIEGIDSRGFGFFEHDHRLFSFRGLVPGDEIEVHDLDDPYKGNPLIRVPSSSRIKPDCPFHGPCGGCDLLELNEKGRIKAKEDLVKRTLSSGAFSSGFKLNPFLASQSTVRYRPRIRLHQSRNPQKPDAGFLVSEDFPGKYSGDIVPVTSCLLVMKPLVRRLIWARRALAQLPFRIGGMQLGCAAAGDKVAAHFVLSPGSTPRRCKPYFERLQKLVQLSGLSMGYENGPVEAVIGSVQLSGLIAPSAEGGPFDAEPAIFFQGNVFQNPRLVDTVLGFCQPGPQKRIVEGFAGAGNFTIPLARAGATVEAVEAHAGAVRLGRRNVFRAKLDSSITIINGDAQKEILKLEPQPDVFLLNPPRTGMPRIRKIVEKLQPQRIVYVSCDIDTLFHDAQNVYSLGYFPVEATGLDLYPRTSRVEVVVHFRKK